MVLDLAAHHSEGVVARVVVDVDPAEARGAAGWDPLLVGVVVHHDGGSRLADTLFTAGENRQREAKKMFLVDQKWRAKEFEVFGRVERKQVFTAHTDKHLVSTKTTSSEVENVRKRKKHNE